MTYLIRRSEGSKADGLKLAEVTVVISGEPSGFSSNLEKGR